MKVTATNPHVSSPVKVLRRLASLKLTLLILLALGTGIIVTYRSETQTAWPLVLPLGLCAINLMAAMASNGAFRRQLPLLLFHLALLSIIVLVGIGRLTYLKGQLELVEGQEFDGVLTQQESGPWHSNRLAQVHFANAGFSIDYAAGIQRGKTQNKVQYLDAKGASHEVVIGDNTPMVFQGYRFYTSFNKGFAPIFLWHSNSSPGAPLLGSINLPAYPIHEYRQALEWMLPGTQIKAWTMLQFDEVILDPAQPSFFRLPEKHRIVMRIGQQRWQLVPGQAIDLPQGRLEYQGLRSWMGYTVFSDWTIHWLLAACMLAVGALGWHFWRKFSARPWNV